MAAQPVAMVTQQLLTVSSLMGTSSDTPTHIHAQTVSDEQQFILPLITHTHTHAHTFQYMRVGADKSAKSRLLTAQTCQVWLCVVFQFLCVCCQGTQENKKCTDDMSWWSWIEENKWKLICMKWYCIFPSHFFLAVCILWFHRFFFLCFVAHSFNRALFLLLSFILGPLRWDYYACAFFSGDIYTDSVVEVRFKHGQGLIMRLMYAQIAKSRKKQRLIRL